MDAANGMTRRDELQAVVARSRGHQGEVARCRGGSDRGFILPQLEQLGLRRGERAATHPFSSPET